MPFEIVKLKHGWFVKNKLTGKLYSSYPLDQATAIKQLHALRRGYGGNDYEGAGVTDFIKSLPNRIFGVINGTRYNFRPQDRKILEQYGNEQINLVKIVREPIQSVVDTIITVNNRTPLSECFVRFFGIHWENAR
jgi:hypothetical protein